MKNTWLPCWKPLVPDSSASRLLQAISHLLNKAQFPSRFEHPTPQGHSVVVPHVRALGCASGKESEAPVEVCQGSRPQQPEHTLYHSCSVVPSSSCKLSRTHPRRPSYLFPEAFPGEQPPEHCSLFQTQPNCQHPMMGELAPPPKPLKGEKGGIWRIPRIL